MTICEALSDFLLEQRIRGNTPKTVVYYDSSIRVFIRFFGDDKQIDAVTLPALRKYYLYLADRELASTSIQAYIRALRAFLTWCYEEELINTNLPEKFKLPKGKRKTIDVLTDAEVSQLMNCFSLNYIIHLRNYCICALMLDSGLRMHEVVTLTLEHLHLGEGYLIVDGKGNKERVVPVGLQCRKMLARYLRRRASGAPTKQVFLMSSFAPITDNTVKQMFQKLKGKTGIARLRAHLLRHTFATRYLENGGDMYALQQILGHTSLEMVKRYVHITHLKTVSSFPQYSPLDSFK